MIEVDFDSVIVKLCFLHITGHQMGESYHMWPLPPYPLIPQHAKPGKQLPPPQQPSSSQQPTSSPQPVPASLSGNSHCHTCTCQNKLDVRESTHYQVHEPVVEEEQYLDQGNDDDDENEEDIAGDCADDSESSWEPSDGEESDDLDDEVEEPYK